MQRALARRRRMRRLVLLDRDGTINAERHYLSAPEQVELLPGAAEGIRRMRSDLASVTRQAKREERACADMVVYW